MKEVINAFSELIAGYEPMKNRIADVVSIFVKPKVFDAVYVDKLFLDDNNFIECTNTEGMDIFSYGRKDKDVRVTGILTQTIDNNFRHSQKYVIAHNNKIKYFRKYSNHDMDEYNTFLYDKFNNTVIGFRIGQYEIVNKKEEEK